MGVLADLNEAPRWLKIAGVIFGILASIATMVTVVVYGWAQLNTGQRNEILSYLPERFRINLSSAADPDEFGVRGNCLRLSAKLSDARHRISRVTPKYTASDTAPVVTACQIAITSFPRDAQLKYELGKALHTAGEDDGRATSLLTQAANGGIVKAMMYLGDLYSFGPEGPKNESEGFRWYQRAADEGSIDGMAEVGEAYIYGRGVAKNVQDGNRWLESAAERGSPAALVELGDSYRFGRGKEKDEAKAAELYEKAADLGDELAMQYLSALNERGINGKVDGAAAVRWLRNAAGAGSLLAMNNLGTYYRMGRLVKEDKAEAMYWFKKAADLGYPLAMYSISLMARSEGKDDREVNEWLLKASNAGLLDAQFELSVAYVTGARGMSRNPDEAIRLLKKAADAKKSCGGWLTRSNESAWRKL
jgi:TPR repeat protein